MPPRRRLSPGEAALWARVTAGVRSADGGRPEPSVAPQRGNGLDRPGPNGVGEDVLASSTPPSPGPSKVRPLRAAKPGGYAETLDATWDRKLATGTVAPDLTIDLHGCSLDQAHDRLDHGLSRAIANGLRVVLLVTGKAPRSGTSRLDLPLRGIIRASVRDWIAAAPYAGRIAAIRPAHPRHGGAGALYIILRRVRN